MVDGQLAGQFHPPLLPFQIRAGSGMLGNIAKLAENQTFLEAAGPCREPTETFTSLQEMCFAAQWETFVKHSVSLISGSPEGLATPEPLYNLVFSQCYCIPMTSLWKFQISLYILMLMGSTEALTGQP